MCDFNEGPADTAVSDFSEIYNLKNIIRENIYFKNPNSLSFIKLIIKNRPKLRVCSLVVSDLRSESKGSRFESGCYPCANVSSML